MFSLWLDQNRHYVLNILEDTFAIYGVTDTSDLDLQWHLFWVSKPNSSLACFLACLEWIPQIHPWCHACWLYCGQHGSPYNLHMFVNISTSIDGVCTQDLVFHSTMLSTTRLLHPVKWDLLYHLPLRIRVPPIVESEIHDNTTFFLPL